MDIETIKEEKMICESKIIAIIDTFEKYTGLVVERIVLKRNFVDIGTSSPSAWLDIKMDVRLRD